MKSGKMLGVMLLLAVAGGAATAAEPVLVQRDGGGIVEEVADWKVVPKGYSDLRITASFKTHNPGVHSDLHGTPDYKVLLKIDGREVSFPANLRKEETETRGVGDAEAGQGVQYRFSKKVRLLAGKHKVLISLPDDNVVVEREITLAEGSRNTLSFEPVYRWTPGKERLSFYGATHFKEGIKEFRVVFNELAM